jgi:phosphoglycolate phosphatase-like HAD superfamily hydrolase
VAEKPTAARFRLVVFDLDGTLVDTRRDLAESTNALIAELGGAALDEALIGSMVGEGVAIWLKRALSAGGVDGPHPPKPAPDGLLAIMQRAGATPPETLLVGDSPIDRHTARDAGARLCVARYGFGYVQSAPEGLAGDEFFIDRPEELAAILSH